MKSLFAIALCGCWTGAAPEAPRATGCTISERVVEAAGTAKLSLRQQTFADVEGPFVRLDITVRGGEAQARIETELVELEGQLALDAMPVRPKQIAIREGWLEVSHAIGRAALDDALRLEVDLPEGLLPRWTSIDVPCDQLTIAKPPEVKLPAQTLELPPGTATTLLREPNGKSIGQWRAPAKPTDPDVPFTPATATELERRGGYVRIRIDGRNAVIGWTLASALAVHDADVYGALFGDEIGETGGRRIRCPSAVPIYVRVDGKIGRVGKLKPDALVFTRASRTAELEIDLGESDVKPFLRRHDIQSCTYP